MKKLFEVFENNGTPLYFVGGFVRDKLMGNVPKDVDMTTAARPDTIQELLTKMGCPVYTIGARFGTIGTKYYGQPIEITTFRAEVYTENSRKPVVTFGDTLEGDLARRDFTINAMAVNSNGDVIDPFNGREDLHNRIIRAVGNPVDRFTEDPLRVLRAIRFAARYEFDIEENTLNAMKTLCGG
jgi:tRNA nucleotidyltransferase/poly(A) polymerase